MDEVEEMEESGGGEESGQHSGLENQKRNGDIGQWPPRFCSSAIAQIPVNDNITVHTQFGTAVSQVLEVLIQVCVLHNIKFHRFGCHRFRCKRILPRFFSCPEQLNR